jgi:FAD/FMN-containing dehydrogenase
MYAIEPIGVVFPRDADDVAAVVSTAGEFGVPVLPRGAGTSLAGQTVGQAIVMDLSRHMSRIIEIDAGQRRVRVQPGVVQEQLNLAAARHGLMFGPDTSTSNRATLGGMIGNNSAGSMSVRYGMTIDHVLALDVVLSDASRSVFGPLTGEELLARAAAATLDGAICRELPLLVERYREAIATGFPRFWRRAGGYRLDRLAGSPGADLAKFVVGSEGTLVTVVEATVQLVPAPRHRVIAVGHFTSVQAAIEATEDALACQPAAVELIDKTILELSRQKLEYRALGSILHGDPEALLFVTFTGGTQAEAAAGLDRLDGRWRAHGHGYHTLRAVHPAEQAALLKVRSAGLGLLMAASTGTRRPLAFVEDTAVDPAVLAAYARRFRQVLDSRGRGGARPGARVRRGQLERARRRARPKRIQPPRVRRPALCGDAGDQAPLRPREPDEPREDRGRTRDDGSPARCGAAGPARAPDAAPLRPPRRHAWRRRPLHEHRSVPQGGDRGHVPLVHGHTRRRALHPGPRERLALRALPA